MLIKFGAEEVYKSQGVDPVKKICHRCGNNSRKYFYQYYSRFHGSDVTYCLKCVSIGRSDSVTPLTAVHVERAMESCRYHLNFDLSDSQKKASERVVQALENNENLLLYAVTGAGKTEISFEAISLARQRGLNVAFVSPRIDVVKEVYLRLAAAFKDARIDLLYSGVKVAFDHRFTVCTVHQLYNHISHFDLIIVDETDAFPLPEDSQLMDAILRAATEKSSIILMTATPSKRMIDFAGRENVVTLTRRYHGYDLAVPEIIRGSADRDIQKNRLPEKLHMLIQNVIARDRRVLIFVPEISMMQQLFPLIREKYPLSASVYSQDHERYLKVDSMRGDGTKVLLTTTILERGVTFENLDVIVLGAEKFNSNSLIQICGRVGRKADDPTGSIWFMAAHHTGSIRRTIKIIKSFNKGETAI